MKLSIALSWQIACFVAEYLSGSFDDPVKFAVGMQALSNAAWREAVEKNPTEAIHFSTGIKPNENQTNNHAC